MWDNNWRLNTWSRLSESWDLIIIGGGITGAGIFNFSARKGLRVLLLEAADFAFGTSSRSSKMVHGGIRYIRNLQLDVVKECVREREHMINEAPGLVEKTGFLFAGYRNLNMPHLTLAFGAMIYDLLAPKWEHHIIRKHKIHEWEPLLPENEMTGSVLYYDACVDDARLVLRVLQDGEHYGGKALNYARVTDLIKDKLGKVIGVRIEDQSKTLTPAVIEAFAPVIINATGPWSDSIRSIIQKPEKLRKLRGSHILFSHQKLPIKYANTMVHPRDHRAIFALPWEGTTIIGTTDLDENSAQAEIGISPQEVDYLLEATNHTFPAIQVNADDIISTSCGIRPIVGSSSIAPSKQSRAHAYWEEDGLVTISGGKLTIFRVMAADVLNFVSPLLPGNPRFDHRDPIFNLLPDFSSPDGMDSDTWMRVLGRHGKSSLAVISGAAREDMQPITPMDNLWCELSYAAAYEAVVHLDDLLLRRVRLGLCLPHGGLEKMERIRSLVQIPCGWSDERWSNELKQYLTIWKNHYYLP